MLTQQTGFSVLTAPLAAIDRRSLSQAWYSALHLAHDGTRVATLSTKQTPLPPANAADRCIAQAERQREARGFPAAHIAKNRRHHTQAHHIPVDRRALRSALARKIERTFLNPRHHVQRATFSLEGTQARVHVSLQRNGSRLRLVAVCAPAVRPAVARALQEARYALADRGIALCFETSVQCS